jgi:hypothetical protein
MYHVPYLSIVKIVDGKHKAANAQAEEWRQVAKPPVLGCGYGLGSGVLRTDNGDGTYTYEAILGEDDFGNTVKKGLLGYAANMGVELTPEQAWFAHNAFKLAYPEVTDFKTGLWARMEKAAVHTIETGESTKVNFVRFSRKTRQNGQHVLRMHLPSCRCLHYINARIETKQMVSKRTGNAYEKKEIYYDGFGHGVGKTAKGGGWTKVYTYGGKLCLAGCTQVITNHGIKDLQNVELCDKLWDGVEWVAHRGLIFKGQKETATWMNLTGTPEHEILAGSEWCALGEMDDRTGRGSHLTGLVSIARLLFSQLPAKKVEPVYAAIAANFLKSIQGQYGEDKFTVARLAELEKAMRKALSDEDTMSSSKKNSVENCLPAATVSSPAVTIPNVRLIQTTAVEEFAYTNRGGLAEVNGFGTSSLFLDGTHPLWTWIESRMMEITNPETSVSSREVETREIEGLLSTLISTVREYLTKTLGSGMFLSGVETTLATTWTAVAPQSGVSKDTKQRGVWDLLNCGPRRRFTVLTTCGPRIVHNCENAVQAISRDILVHAMRLADAMGGKIFIHVHDEIGVLAKVADPFEFSFADLQWCMTQVPSWAPGLILGADGYSGGFYKKG